MNTFSACIKNELDKILRRKKYRILPILIICITVFGALIGNIPNSIISFSMSNYPYAILSLCCYLLIPFVAFTLTSDIISSECEKKELKNLLTRHISRTEILFGKLTAIIVYALLLTTGNVIIALIFSLIFSGFASVNILAVLLSVCITVIPIIAFVSFAGFISVLCKNGVSAFGTGILAYGGFILLGLVFSRISSSIFTSYLALYKMVIGHSIPIFRLILGIAVLLGFSLMFLSGAGMKFERKEF